MEKYQIHRNTPIDWSPSAIVALSSSTDGSKVAAAREDGSLELWTVSPGAVDWHLQLTIQGRPDSRVSYLVWCRERLLSSSVDGSISEWDLFSLEQKSVLDTIGVSIWQMAVEPIDDCSHDGKTNSKSTTDKSWICYVSSDSESSDVTDNEYDSDESSTACIDSKDHSLRLAIACDDGSLSVYSLSDKDGLTYHRSFPRVNGRTLCVTWSLDAKSIFSGSSDGIIRCWDATSFRETYRITVGLGGLCSGSELCVWSLLFLRCGTLVSGHSSGSVQFWNSHNGTHLQAHTYHKGDVNALATSPCHKNVFSAGSDGQVILYRTSDDHPDSGKEGLSSIHVKNWVYVGYKRVHSHDIRALTVAVPITNKDTLPDENLPKLRKRARPTSFSYRKWAQIRVPMLISSGDDSKLFAYPANKFTLYEPHDICPTPQRVPIQLIPNSAIDRTSMMLAQHPDYINVTLFKLNHDAFLSKPLNEFKIKSSRKIICSAVSNSGILVAYSDSVKPYLFELKRYKCGNSGWCVNKLQLPRGLPYSHCIAFSADSLLMLLAGHNGKLHVVDVRKSELVHTFVPQRKEGNVKNSPKQLPITKMYTSSDGRWLAAVGSFGDIYVFNLETFRQHWFIPRVNDSSVTAGGFIPKHSDMFVITTSANQIYVFDVEAKQLSDWSRYNSPHLPKKFQEFPGEINGISFPPSNATSLIVYSARAMCSIEIGMSSCEDDNTKLSSSSDQPTSSPDGAKSKKNKRKIVDRTYDVIPFKDPVSFVGHLSESSLLVAENRWMDVIKKYDAPVHKHVYGT